MRGRLLWMLPATALLAGQAPAPTTSETPIVIEGTRDSAAKIERYVKTFSKASAGDKIGRFEKPVCPVVVGLRKDHNVEVESRIRRVAAEAGLDVLKPGCEANFLVVMTSDRKELFAKWLAERPDLFGGLSSGQIQALINSAEPAVAWHILELRGSDGRPLGASAFPRSASGGSGSMGSEMMSQEAVTSSRLLPMVRADFGLAIVVIDGKAAAGATYRQLADFAAMRGLALTDSNAAEKVGAPSILTLLLDKQAERPAPLSVTAWDIAYLKALYGMSNNLRAAAQRSELVQIMNKELKSAN